MKIPEIADPIILKDVKAMTLPTRKYLKNGTPLDKKYLFLTIWSQII